MKEKTMAKDMWEAAGYAGLALGLVSAAYMLVNSALATSGLSTGMNILIQTPLWIAKFIGCILLMKFFMKKFHTSNTDSTHKDVYKMGVATALLSSFLFSAIQFVFMTYVQADLYAEQYEIIMQQYSSGMDLNTMNMMENFIDLLPQISFFGNLLYCFAYGSVLAAILSRSIVSNDPFADFKQDEQ
ncbi:MAG: DUF4199 domain-containing protein [Bacteroidales bacterium]|nr:DUF4199 domain-containing protein [Bacteroidales bacterium]